MSCDCVLPPLAADANKYTRGKLVVIAGSDRYPGSAVLAACASERMGTGYTEVVTTSDALPIVRAASPSLVAGLRKGFSSRVLAKSRLGHPVAVCMGSGFEGDEEERALVSKVLRKAACPVLVDGTALRFLGGKEERRALRERAKRGCPTVLTPHGGEAAVLAEAAAISESGSYALSQALAEAYRSIVVLKGPVTYIAANAVPNASVRQLVRIMNEGTPALAKAGSGDVLAGMIGSLLAQGEDPFQAAYVGACIHGRAGALAARRRGVRSVIATDVIDAIPAIIQGE